ncbi:MAG: diguanylate cyclase [Deltaproteobacteria bacterium]|nr:diguanylate cyclase [Deltaproteobacteria bacterium]
MSKLTFKQSDTLGEPQEKVSEDRIKIIIADDEQEVHAVTRFALKDYQYKGKKLEFLSAYSGEGAKQLLRDNPGASLILLDIVMEKDDSGLDVAEFIREDLHNNLIRIILRTGQPGMAPEEEVIYKYDINDYKEKTELTSRKFRTAMTMALRSYAEIVTIESFRIILEQEVQARTAELQQKNNELERLNKELERHATRDALTGAHNRMKFDTILEAEIQRCKRYNHAVSLAMIDIDYFKQINDRHGHAAGDSALREIVALISSQIGACDVLARWGGEEFMILFPETTLEATRVASEKLRQEIEDYHFDKVGKMTCSFGVTQLLHDDDFESLNKRVDDSLYEAKRTGRNKVICK